MIGSVIMGLLIVIMGAVAVLTVGHLIKLLLFGDSSTANLTLATSADAPKVASTATRPFWNDSPKQKWDDPFKDPNSGVCDPSQFDSPHFRRWVDCAVSAHVYLWGGGRKQATAWVHSSGIDPRNYQTQDEYIKAVTGKILAERNHT